MIKKVQLAKAVQKALGRLPHHVVIKLQGWVHGVETFGLDAMRIIPGYHDELLRGERSGQRSIRLSRGYRAFYTVEKGAARVEYVQVIEVNKHEY